MTRLLAFSLAAASLAACSADNGDEALFLSKVLAPNPDCAFTASKDEPYQARGYYTPNEFENYRAVVQLISNITATPDQVVQRTVQLRGARVSLERSDGEAFSGVPEQYVRFTSLGAGPVSPNGGITDSSFDVVSREFGMAFGEGEIVATIEVFGDLAGDEVVSQQYKFPIVLSRGMSAGMCPLPAGTELRAGGGCGIYQDAPFTCCETAGGDLKCPADVATTPL